MTGKKNIYQRILAVTEAIRAFGKDGKNTQFNFRYAGIEAIIRTLQPVLIEHGICLIQEGDTDGTIHAFQGSKGINNISTCTVITHAINVDDPTDRVTTRTPSQGYDSLDKGIYKALSGGRKYGIFGMFNLHADDDAGEPDSYNAPQTRSDATRATRPASGDHPTEKQVNLMYGKAKKLFPDGEDSFRAYIKAWVKYTDDPEQLTYADGTALIEWMKKKESEGR